MNNTITGRAQSALSGIIAMAAVLAGMSLLISCSDDKIVGDEGGDIDTLLVTDWTEPTHGNSTDPNYDEVFSDGVVRRVDIVIDSSDWQAMLDDMTLNYGAFGSSGGSGPGNTISSTGEDPIWVPCSIFYEGIEWYKVGVRFKGNSSLRTAWQRGVGKLSFKLDFDEFEDQYSQILNQRFYGFKQLNLGNGFEDESLIRERAAAEIFREAGLPAASTSFCRVYVDHGAGPVYFGLYTIVEEVDDTVIDDLFDDDSGNLYKPEGNGATFADGTFNVLDFTKKSNEYDSDWSDIQTLFDVLHSETRTTNPAVWRSALDSILYVEGFLHWLAVNTVIQNWDTYGIMAHNYYLYNDPAGNHLTWIPWDNNESLQDGKQGGALSLYLDEVGDRWPLISFLMDDSVYREIYNGYVRNTIESAFEPSRVIANYQAWHDLIAPYVVGSEGEIAGYTFLSSSAAFDSELGYLISHVSQREAKAIEYLVSVE